MLVLPTKYAIPRDLAQSTVNNASDFLLLNNEFLLDKYVFGFEIYSASTRIAANVTTSKIFYNTNCNLSPIPWTTSTSKSKTFTSFLNVNKCVTTNYTLNVTNLVNQTIGTTGIITLKVNYQNKI